MNAAVVQSWSSTQAAEWLDQTAQGRLAALVREHSLTGEDLLDLSHDDLVSIGIASLVERKRLLRPLRRWLGQ